MIIFLAILVGIVIFAVGILVGIKYERNDLKWLDKINPIAVITLALWFPAGIIGIFNGANATYIAGWSVLILLGVWEIVEDIIEDRKYNRSEERLHKSNSDSRPKGRSRRKPNIK